MSGAALVSVGLPVYNGAKYIGECIDSVLAQSYQHFELVISDNASTDATAEICLSYAAKDSRIRYVRQPENRGAMPNFDYVLRHSTGKYFMWLAADDRIAATFVEKLHGLLEKHPDFALVMSDAVIIDGRGAVVTEVAIDPIRLDRAAEEWISTRRVFFRSPTSKTYFCICGLGRRDVLLQANINYKGMVRHLEGSEMPFLAQVALKGKIGTVPELLWFHRHHDGSYSIRSDARITRRQRVDNMVNISSTLFRIAGGAELGIVDKLAVFWTICWTLGKGLLGVMPGVGALYRRLSS